jgi:hypothetical protein
MPSLWRRVVGSKKARHGEVVSTASTSPLPAGEPYQPDDETTSSTTRLHYITTGYGMQLLRQVHLIDPLHSPSWSGQQRTPQLPPSILHLLESTFALAPEAAVLLPPHIITPTHNPNMLAIRGLLLDTIKHVGPAMDSPGGSSSLNSQYLPPKWLTKLAVSPNSTTLREAPLVASPPSLHRPNPQIALQEKYHDFMQTVFLLAFQALNSPDSSPESSPKTPAIKPLFSSIRMCVTEAGYFGLVPQSVRPGDNIFMVERDAPKSVFVVRRHPVHGFFLWNGVVYVHRLAEVVGNEFATDRIVVG